MGVVNEAVNLLTLKGALLTTLSFKRLNVFPEAFLIDKAESIMIFFKKKKYC